MKSPQLAGLSTTSEGNSLKRRLVGWRRSADRACLQANSLVSGNFTGNFAILGLRDTIWVPRNRCAAPLIEQFPTEINRKNILENRESFSDIREFHL
jgi:hypothetical protein